jgi:hypothetical protein
MTAIDRRCRNFMVGGLGAVIVAAVTPAVATAAPAIDASCAHPATVDFSPGLTLTSQPTAITATGTLSTCVSSAVKSGTLSGGASSNALSCTSGAVSGQLVFEWVTAAGTEARSVVTLSGQDAGFLALAISGTVTSGLFAGDSYTVTFAANPLVFVSCLTPAGVTQFMGSAVSVFSHT